jgi:hypothetical protein
MRLAKGSAFGKKGGIIGTSTIYLNRSVFIKTRVLLLAILWRNPFMYRYIITLIITIGLLLLAFGYSVSQGRQLVGQQPKLATDFKLSNNKTYKTNNAITQNILDSIDTQPTVLLRKAGENGDLYELIHCGTGGFSKYDISKFGKTRECAIFNNTYAIYQYDKDNISIANFASGSKSNIPWTNPDSISQMHITGDTLLLTVSSLPSHKETIVKYSLKTKKKTGASRQFSQSIFCYSLDRNRMIILEKPPLFEDSSAKYKIHILDVASLKTQLVVNDMKINNRNIGYMGKDRLYFAEFADNNDYIRKVWSVDLNNKKKSLLADFGQRKVDRYKPIRGTENYLIQEYVGGSYVLNIVNKKTNKKAPVYQNTKYYSFTTVGSKGILISLQKEALVLVKWDLLNT